MYINILCIYIYTYANSGLRGGTHENILGYDFGQPAPANVLRASAGHHPQSSKAWRGAGRI